MASPSTIPPVSTGSIDLNSPDRPFDNIINFRDVGRTINHFVGKRVLKEGVFYRSARLDEASERDKRRLSSELHIATIIDLRSGTEHQMATEKRRLMDRGTDADIEVPPTTDPLHLHLQALPGIRRYLISLTGRSFERALAWKLDWWNFAKVLAYLASGYRKDAIMLIGEQVMKPRGLIGLGQDTLDSSFVEIRGIFEIFAGVQTGSDTSTSTSTGGADGTSFPILVHCTQGKDRTGLVVLLALLVTGVVGEEALAAEYMLSEAELEADGEAGERMKEMRALGLDEEFARCPSGFTGAIRGYLDERYGGVERYLGMVGIEAEMIERIRGGLVA